MAVALPPSLTPSGLGIAYDNTRVFVVSQCCSAELDISSFNRYYCYYCGKGVTVPVCVAPTAWMTSIDLVEEAGDDRLLVNGEEIMQWLSAWTGIDVEDMEAKVELV